jgi:hypothetical protein
MHALTVEWLNSRSVTLILCIKNMNACVLTYLVWVAFQGTAYAVSVLAIVVGDLGDHNVLDVFGRGVVKAQFHKFGKLILCEVHFVSLRAHIHESSGQIQLVLCGSAQPKNDGQELGLGYLQE